MDPKSWAMTWKNNSRILDEIYKRELREIVTSQALQNLSAAYRFAELNSKPRASSGLVEMQRILRKSLVND